MDNLKATKRDKTSSGSTNALRTAGFIPAILYGGKDPNQKISIEKKAVREIILEIPVKFINHPDSPGLKRGGVLNIVRRAVELKCPGENIPNDITVDLAGSDIGTSIKISSVKLPENVVPTITDRDFVIATVAAPTIIKEPEKPAETETAEGAEGEVPAEGAEGAAKEGDPSKKDEKGKEAAAGDKKPDEKKPAEKKPAEKK